MLRIAGRYGDAWFPEGAVVTRKHGYAERLDVVRSAASDAGRDPQAVTPAGAAFVVTGFGRDEVDEALQSDAVKSAALLAPAEIWPATVLNTRWAPTRPAVTTSSRNSSTRTPSRPTPNKCPHP
jgi:alkanesulfonate monooxygenase SsuD/methylene tetrahydromethanopterin reductase-like flavin-dependent oxidoreductase (luciferase family)